MGAFSSCLFSLSGEPESVLIASRHDVPGRPMLFARVLVDGVEGGKGTNVGDHIRAAKAKS